MNICILSKFPPLQGGISAKTYWLAKAYANAGHNVHVVSNSNLTEEEYHIDGCYPHIENLDGITLHEVKTDWPWHIPNEPHSLARLIDKALEVVEEYAIDVIDAGYLVPYGISAFMVHKIIGVPYVVRHGGSDIAKFLTKGRLSQLFQKTLAAAAFVISDNAFAEILKPYSRRIQILPSYVPDPDIFTSPTESNKENRLLFIGKINWHWERKSLLEIAKIAESLGEDWQVDWVGGGKGLDRFKKALRDSGIDSPRVLGFVPPWEMPKKLERYKAVFCLRGEETIPSFLNIIPEALACGATPIVSTNFNLGHYEEIWSRVNDDIIAIDTNDISKAVSTIEEANSRGTSCQLSRTTHNNYIQGNLAALNLT